MTWSIHFQVDQGNVDPETLKVDGTPPDGPMSVSGYQSGDHRSLNVSAGGISIGAGVSPDPAVAREES